MDTEVLNESTNSSITTLEHFIKNWGNNYAQDAEKLPLFNTNLVKKWSTHNIKRFVTCFYHIRGHFHDFMWQVASKSKKPSVKKIILDNISEEINCSGKSHEKLYLQFAHSLNINLEQEFATQQHNSDIAQLFNKGHLLWLSQHSPNACFAAFSAYEKLDNLDYKYLYNIAKTIQNDNVALTFFKIHNQVKHFDNTYKALAEVWINSHKTVIDAFNFIGEHQLKMWQELYTYIVD